MFISEVFTSLQGEGSLVGTPSFFIRTSGCNLRCSWCDTPYTSWKAEGRRYSVDELVNLARQSGVAHVVVTGGEPLLQREIGLLTGALREAGLHLTVETAGTLAPAFDCDLLSLSPKTENSDPAGRWAVRHRRLRSELACARDLLKRFPEHQLKFVVRGAEDMSEILRLLSLMPPIDPWRILLMPEGRSAEEVAEKAGGVAVLCAKHGFRYTPRLHLDLFGGGRGV
ncbi:MAG: 7-carboxy-7-deazaguanine synthase QueE [Thermoanaerobaculales bacterium]|nr:7-carboxy-7-deazaguanine synthase QueE [Thermoanaerobaculales bacterium]